MVLRMTRPYGLSSAHKIFSRRAGAEICPPRFCCSAAAAGLAGDGQIAAHGARQIFHGGEAETGAAVAPGDIDAGLGERPEQTLDLGWRQADAAVAYRHDELETTARRRPRLRLEPDGALRGELHRIVDEVLERRAQPHRIAEQKVRQIVGEADRRLQALDLRPHRKRFRHRLEQARRPERFLLQSQRARFHFGGVDHKRGQGRQMLGTGLDADCPLALALTNIGACQQFAERQDAGERGADVVGERGEHDVLIGGRRPPLPPTTHPSHGGSPFRLFGPRSRHGAPRLVLKGPAAPCHGCG